MIWGLSDRPSLNNIVTLLIFASKENILLGKKYRAGVPHGYHLRTKKRILFTMILPIGRNRRMTFSGVHTASN